MTHIETARVNEVIGIKIGAIHEEAEKLNANSDLQEIEAGIAALEKAIAELKDIMAAVPHRRQ